MDTKEWFQKSLEMHRLTKVNAVKRYWESSKQIAETKQIGCARAHLYLALLPDSLVSQDCSLNGLLCLLTYINHEQILLKGFWTVIPAL